MSVTISSKGYARVYWPDHPLADRSGMAYLHRIQLWVLGTILRRGKTGHHVHHVNGDKLDNRPENLVRLPARVHNGMRRGR